MVEENYDCLDCGSLLCFLIFNQTHLYLEKNITLADSFLIQNMVPKRKQALYLFCTKNSQLKVTVSLFQKSPFKKNHIST